MRNWLLLALAVLGLDQASKLAVAHFLRLGDSIAITPFFNLVLAHNSGAAFSFLADASGWQRHFFTVLALAVSMVIVRTLSKHPELKLQSLALSLILGGAVGNVIDRLLYGHVIDFIQVYYRAFYWPAFNVADSAICVGAALMVFDSFKHPHKTSEPRP